jgi:hypothetical protein
MPDPDYFCQFKGCFKESPTSSLGWITVIFLKNRKRVFCSPAHAIYYISDPVKNDADPDDEIEQLGITA